MTEKTVPMTTSHNGEGKAPATRDDQRFLIPPVDIFESGDGLTVMADLPGVEKDQLEVRVDNNILTIQGKVSYGDRGDRSYTEFQLLDFFRQFELAESVDQQKITAELKHGVLTLHLPKAEAHKPRTIAIQVA